LVKEIINILRSLNLELSISLKKNPLNFKFTYNREGKGGGDEREGRVG